jgi:hypothetical protein
MTPTWFRGWMILPLLIFIMLVFSPCHFSRVRSVYIFLHILSVPATSYHCKRYFIFNNGYHLNEMQFIFYVFSGL